MGIFGHTFKREKPTTGPDHDAHGSIERSNYDVPVTPPHRNATTGKPSPSSHLHQSLSPAAVHALLGDLPPTPVSALLTKPLDISSRQAQSTPPFSSDEEDMLPPDSSAAPATPPHGFRVRRSTPSPTRRLTKTKRHLEALSLENKRLIDANVDLESRLQRSEAARFELQRQLLRKVEKARQRWPGGIVGIVGIMVLCVICSALMLSRYMVEWALRAIRVKRVQGSADKMAH